MVQFEPAEITCKFNEINSNIECNFVELTSEIAKLVELNSVTINCKFDEVNSSLDCKFTEMDANFQPSFGQVTYVYKGDAETYSGAYTVQPSFSQQVLSCQEKLMLHNVTVNPIKVEKVSNTSNGLTVCIGG